MESVVVSIDTEGTATYLVNEHTKGLFPDAQEPRRATHIEPELLPLRLAFRALRKAFGDDGTVAAWTRSWTIGTWQADFTPIGESIVHGFQSHAQAVRFEVYWLQNHWLGR